MSTDVVVSDSGVREMTSEFTAAPVAKAFIEDTAMCSGYFGPLGTGKTSAGVMKAYYLCRAWPGARIAVVRDTWPNLRDTTQHTFFDWFPEGVAGQYVSTRKTFYLWGNAGEKTSEILFRAMDDKDDMKNVLSLDISSFWIDEPQGGLATRNESTEFTSEQGIDHDLFLGIMGRLGRQKGYPGLAWLTGNPPDPHHWIAQEFRYKGSGPALNPREDFHLYLGDQDTNRMHLQHTYQGTTGETECRLCGLPRDDVRHQRDYYGKLEELYGTGTPLALRFLHGRWVSFALLNPFREEWFQYWDDRPKLESMFMCLGVDPAISKKDTANRSAVVVAGQPTAGLYRTTAFVLRSTAGHWTPYELCGQVLKVVQDFPGLRKIRIEQAQWQGALKDIVEREADLQGIHLPSIDLVPVSQDKLLRANGWSGLVESGRVLFGPGQTDLVDCCCKVPRDQSKWDPVDATGLALGGLPNLRAELSPIEQEQLGKKRAISYAVKNGAEPRTLLLHGSREYVKTILGRAAKDRKSRAQGYAIHRGMVP